MDTKYLIINFFKLIIFFLPLVQSFLFTWTEVNSDNNQSWYTDDVTEDNKHDTQVSYTDLTTQLNHIDAQASSTDLTQLNNIDAQASSTDLTTQLNNIDAQASSTDLTQLNNTDIETELFNKQQEIIVHNNTETKQHYETEEIVIKNATETDLLNKSYDIIVKNETQVDQLNKPYDKITAKSNIGDEMLSKLIEICVKNNTKTEQLNKPYGKFVKNDPKMVQLNKPYEIFIKNFKNNIKPNPPVFYNSPPEYNPNLSKTPNYSPFLNLKGKYCETRPGRQCCPSRQDDCSVPVLGTLCYCDHFCDRTPNKQVKHASPDCCPDYYSVCTNSSIDSPSSGWSPWSMCSKICGMGEEIRSRATNNGTETQRRPCLVSRCPVPPQTQCGGLYRRAIGTIDYPAGLENYPNDANCRWIIATQPYSTIELSIVSFNTQRQHDYLTIREHNISTFSANMSGIMEGVIMTASNIVTLIFTSDDSVTDSGFIINWKEKLAPSLSVEVWMCKDAWPGEECIFDKESSNGGPVCSCRDAHARGWCENDYRSTRRVCEATCNPLCTPNDDVVTKDNFKLKQENKFHKGKEGHLNNLPFTDRKNNEENRKTKD